MYRRAERHAHLQASASEIDYPGVLGEAAKMADYPRLLEHERGRIQQLQGQIAALRELAARHSPGVDSAGLAWKQAQQLAGLLEQHRDELRVLLNGHSTFDTLDDDSQSGLGSSD